MPHLVTIIGAGTMGAGIAQVAASAGWRAVLVDVDVTVAQRAVEQIGDRFARLVEKGRMVAAAREEAMSRLSAAAALDAARDAALLIEAVIEDLDVKARVLRDVLPALPGDAIIATNTSSLSVSAIGERIGQARRTVGMHFFNPAPLMALVEVIAGRGSDPAIVQRTAEIAESWGKRVARSADVPGFIVNHVARPYYLEAFRLLEESVAGPALIDGAMKRLGGFRMGPLELTDLIGQDVNTATTRSVWEQLGQPPLLHPSALQEQLVAEGHLGRKTGRGVYDYGGPEPVEAIEIEPRGLHVSPELAAAVDRFVAGATDHAAGADQREGYVFARILSALITQAKEAVRRGVAEPADIDVALRYGTNHPRGPFEWAARIGEEAVRAMEGRHAHDVRSA